MDEIKRELNRCKEHLDEMKIAKNADEFRDSYVDFVSHGRRVTFTIQKRMTHKPFFRDWYKRVQERYKADRVCNFFNKERTEVEHCASNSLKFKTFIHSFNSSLDVIDRPLNSNIELSGEGVKLRINAGTPQERLRPIEHKGKTTTSVWVEVEGKDENVLDLCEEYYLILEKDIEDLHAQYLKFKGE